MKFLIFLAFSCLFSFNISGENFRVRKLIPIRLSGLEEKITVTSGINDALYITLPEDLTYISGLELNMKIPEEIMTWRDSVAYMLYNELNPSPNEKDQNYYGNRVFLDTVPGKLSLTLYIPVSEDFSIKENPYSVKLPVQKLHKTDASQKDGIFIRFMMVMKGVPDSLEKSTIDITAKPVLKEKGALALTTTPASSEEKKYSVFIDDIPIQNYSNNILSTGEHHLSIVSDSYRNELRTFRIEKAKTTVLDVNLRGIEPTVKVLAPANVQVLIDGKQASRTNSDIVIQPGEHKIKFIFGGYEVEKSFSALNGRSYTVNLDIDASVSEEL